MCVRGEAIRQVGLLDERYHMYVEEIDWSRRVLSAGWKAYCVPAATVTHWGGQSTTQIPTPSFINLWTSRYRFYHKHYPPLKVWFAAQIVRAGLRRKARHDSRAVRLGELSPSELNKRKQSYERVIKIWQVGDEDG